jgi:hypothetical protein
VNYKKQLTGVTKSIDQMARFGSERRKNPIINNAVTRMAVTLEVNNVDGCQWCTPIILATQEAEIRRITV